MLKAFERRSDTRAPYAGEHGCGCHPGIVVVRFKQLPGDVADLFAADTDQRIDGREANLFRGVRQKLGRLSDEQLRIPSDPQCFQSRKPFSRIFQ